MKTIAVLGLLAALAATRPVSAGFVSRVSVASDGVPGNYDSDHPGMSADGRFVVFQSLSGDPTFTTTLVPGGRHRGIFLRDRTAGTTTLVSVDDAGAEADDFSSDPAISADGTVVSFRSVAGNLGPPASTFLVFVRDLVAGTTTLASADSANVAANGECGSSALSGDGNLVAFDSIATNLVAGDTNGVGDIFVRDRSAGTTTRVSVDSLGAQANENSYSPSISADGRFVVFDSFASNLVPGDTNGVFDVFVHDLMTGTTERVSVSSGGVEGNERSGVVAGQIPSASVISADGRFVLFASRATNLVSPPTASTQIFLRDRLLGTTEVASQSGGVEADGGALAPGGITADGVRFTFSALSIGFPRGGPILEHQVWLRDRVADTTTLVSAKNQNVPPVTGRSTYSALSADGTIVAFDSLALDLVPGDANASTDVFTSQVGAICGNGVIEGDEQCDDGNVVDGDGCDANCYPTLCAGGVTIDHASISIRSSGTIDEKIKTLTFKGRLPFAVGSPPGFAPQSTGAQVVVEGLGSAFMGQPVVARPVFDLSFRNVPVPPGLAGVGGPGCRSRDGWHARPTSFNYGSTSDAIDLGLCIAGSAGGLRKITLSDRRTTKGYIGFSVTVSRGGRIDLFGGNGSFRGTVVLGASPAAGQSGACGAVTLSPPACKFDQTHDTIRCR